MDDRPDAIAEARAREKGFQTARQRLALMEPQCGFGELGLCCRMCYMGPCRVDPFGAGPKRGVCGADADTIVTRNFLREAVGGAASHIGHARSVALAVRAVGAGVAEGYPIEGVEKLRQLASGLGIAADGKSAKELARETAEAALADFGRQDGEPMTWLKLRAPAKEYEVWEKQGLVISNPHNEIESAMHRTTMGNDADPVNLLLAQLRMGLADGYAGLTLATDMQDVLFGTPSPRVVEVNFGVLDPAAVNLAVHGHSPVLSEKVLQWAEQLEGEAREAGATRVNAVGVCCTGNELTMRHGIPMAAHNLQAELLIMTGVVDAMAVDVQCIWPALALAAECYDTALITTEPIARIPGAVHIPFEVESADEAAAEMVRKAIAAFGARAGREVSLPDAKTSGLAGFSVESIVGVLSKVNAEDPVGVVVDKVAAGDIHGFAAFAGCPSVKLRDTRMTERMAGRLLRENVLVVTTGCTAHILAQAGFLSPQATETHAGERLRGVLAALGEAAGLDGPLPPVWHMGSCVDNSRIGDLVAAVAARLDVPISALPVVASAPELVTEKAIAIGTWLLDLGLPLHLAPAPRILGSPVATRVLTEDLKGITGGFAFVETDPDKAADRMLEVIAEKRAGLGI